MVRIAKIKDECTNLDYEVYYCTDFKDEGCPQLCGYAMRQQALERKTRTLSDTVFAEIYGLMEGER